MTTESLKKFAAATNNELFDPEYKGGEWMVESAETHETIEQFIESSARWNEKSPMVEGQIDGFRFVTWKRIQPTAGASRRAVSVIDLGDVRYSINTDLTVF